MEIAIAQILCFFAVFLLVLGIPAAFRRTKEPEEAKRMPLLLRAFHHEVTAMGAATLGLTSAKAEKEIQNLLLAAGLPLNTTHIRGMRLFACAVGGATLGIVIFLTSLNPGAAVGGLLLGGFMGWIWPMGWLRGTAKLRQDEMSRTMPFAIDLLTVAMEAGQDFVASVRHLVNEGLRGPLAEEFGRVLREIELGKSREEALKSMAARVQLQEFNSLVASVMQSAEMGASIAKTLKIQAEEIRRNRFHKAEKQAARAPSLMLIPMALFILPAVFIIIFTPVVIRVMDSGIGNFFGK